jgi:hypothetical protein
LRQSSQYTQITAGDLFDRKRKTMRNESDGPIFMLSTGRCGTLALQRFLQRSNEIEAFHRYRGRKSKYRNDMSFVLEQNYAYYHIVQDPVCEPKRKRFIISNLRRCRAHLIEAVRQEGKKFIETNHEFSPFAPLLVEAFPDAKFVHLVRNPKSVISSFMQKFDPPLMKLPAYMGTRYSLIGQYLLRYNRVKNLTRRWPLGFARDFVDSHQFDTHLHPFEQVNGKWREKPGLDSFEKTCWYWNTINRLLIEFFSNLPEEKKLIIHFEEIFIDKKYYVMELFLDFLRVRDLTVLDMKEFLSKPINVKEHHHSFPISENWSKSMLDVLHHYCRETMWQLGYFIK